MEEQWYTITGGIDVNTAHNLITYVNGQIYGSNIKKLKILISSGAGLVQNRRDLSGIGGGKTRADGVKGFFQARAGGTFPNARRPGATVSPGSGRRLRAREPWSAERRV